MGIEAESTEGEEERRGRTGGRLNGGATVQHGSCRSGTNRYEAGGREMLERRSLLAAVLNCTSDTSYSIASQVASHRISGPSHLGESRARAHTHTLAFLSHLYRISVASRVKRRLTVTSRVNRISVASRV